MDCNSQITVIVLTGGPCGGKTTALAMLRQKMVEYGVEVFVVPETATLLFTNGFNPEVLSATLGISRELQKRILLHQIRTEDLWKELIKLHGSKRALLICDRGAMDGAAYVGKAEFEAMLHDLSIALVEIQNKRYHAVFHMVTAANGVESEYNLDNPARHEDLETALLLDQKTLNAWTGHEHLKIISNYEYSNSGEKKVITFEQKLDNLLRQVCGAVGIPAPLEIERKFCLEQSLDTALFPVPHLSEARIEQDYLVSSSPNLERRVRKIQYLNTVFPSEALFVYTEKVRKTNMSRLETERIISATEYLELLVQKDSCKQTIKKTRYSFVWEAQYFQLDRFIQPTALDIVEVELTTESDVIQWPSFLGQAIEVTDNLEFTNSFLAQKP